MELEELLQRIRGIDPSIDTATFGPLDALYAYRLILGRNPDIEGWRHWSQNRIPVRLAVDIFQHSQEGRLQQSPPPVRVTTKRGFDIFVDPLDANIGSAIVRELDYESNVSEFFVRELAGKEGTFVDVGANIGWYMLLSRTASPGLRAIGFEPNPGNIQLALRSLERRGLVESKLYPFALSNRNRFLGLEFVRLNGVVREDFANKVMVKGVPGDEHLKDEERIPLIKMDIDGHEPMALEGLAGTIAKHRPVLIVEFHSPSLRNVGGIEPQELLLQLTQMGYSLGVIERDATGTETRLPDIPAVMAALHRHNSAQGLTDELHLDLVARPH